MTSVTLNPGETLHTVGDQVEPAGYFVKAVQGNSGWIQQSNKDGLTKKVGAGEGFGFGGEAFILSNIENEADAAAYGKDHGLVKLDTSLNLKTAKYFLVNGMQHIILYQTFLTKKYCQIVIKNRTTSNYVPVQQ